MDSKNDGCLHYLCCPEDRDWFEEQWRIWPFRAHPDRPTSLAFLYGGLQVYRDMNEFEPEMSERFRENVKWLDKHD